MIPDNFSEVPEDPESDEGSSDVEVFKSEKIVEGAINMLNGKFL